MKTLNVEDDGAINCVKFDHSGKYIAYCGGFGARITVVKDWEKQLSYQGHEKQVMAVSWGDESSSWFSTAGHDKFTKIWGLRDDNDMETN